MEFNRQDWIRRVQEAKDGEELRKLIRELPMDNTLSTEKGAQSFSTTAPQDQRKSRPEGGLA